MFIDGSNRKKAKHKRDMLYRTQQQRQAHIQRPKRVESVQEVLAEYIAQLTQARMAYIEQCYC